MEAKQRGRLGTFVVAGALATLVLLGCGAPTPDRTELVDALETSGLPAEVARCAADALVGSLSSDQLDQLVERGNGGAPVDDPDRTDDAADRLREALSACQGELPAPTVAPGNDVAPDGVTTPSTGTGTASTLVPTSTTTPAASSSVPLSTGAGGGDGARLDTAPPSTG